MGRPDFDDSADSQSDREVEYENLPFEHAQFGALQSDGLAHGDDSTQLLLGRLQESDKSRKESD